ncbi:MAG: DUF362 domain-containing protein [Clostridiales bacterium]|nr:DUF362 domain-containing protein [Clostridiales bacterium]
MSKVAVVNCNSYDVNEVYKAVSRGIELMGGLEQLINKNERVLLKPNLLASANPDKSVTTHPSVFEAVIRIFKENEYSVFYGDSPGFENPEKVSQRCGLKTIADKYDVVLGNFSKGSTIAFKEGKITKQFEISYAAQEADAIVSLCKMKTHQLTRITGAVKNQLGCVYGLNKPSSHAKFPDAISFSKMLVDLNMLLKPRLYIMDGIVAMEGNGPRSGEPVPMNVLLVSEDPVALDSVFCRLIDLKPEYVPTIVYGEEYGLGKWRDEDIRIIGDDINEFVNKDFNVIRKPVISENFGFASRFRNRVLRKPVIIERKCVKCGICVDVCPAEGKAVNFKNSGNDKTDPPVFQYKKCIRCYCCQEMCPQKAIEVKTPLLGKMLLYK